MNRAFLNWLRCLAAAVPFVLGFTGLVALSALHILFAIFAIPTFLVLLSAPLVYKLLKPITSDGMIALFDREVVRQGKFLDELSPRAVAAGVFFSAALSLLLELAVIRWQASSLEFFTFFKNFGLIACFAGLGIGYSLSKAPRIPVLCSVGLLGWQVAFVTALKQLNITLVLDKPPLLEDASIRRMVSANLNLEYWAAIYLVLALIFCLTGLAFVPVGRLCGSLMGKMKQLPAYGLNLLGSLFGVLLMSCMSYIWTPPMVWFAICLLLCTLFSAYNVRTVLISTCISIGCLILLICPTRFAVSTVHSPYQVIELSSGEHGWSEITAAGYYYQRVLDLTKNVVAAYPELARSAAYYNLPYQFAPHPANVLILGAGAGNDVSAALRAGAQHVDAVEIDPAIAQFGTLYHPEHPYGDKRVNLVLDDGRAFLRRTHTKYDVIVYALIDSHALSSSGSALRVDSYIYTLESFKEARAHLTASGIMALSFVGVVPQLQSKVFMMLKSAFDQHEPIALASHYDSSSSFIESATGNISIPTEVADDSHLERRNIGGDASIDLSTDDWPFFYMPKRQFPFSYLPLVGLVLALSFFMVRSLNRSRLDPAYMPFFWLGAGFMLVETKGITELGLQFGNTWFVTAIVIAAVISMAFISNLAVDRLKFSHIVLPGILLIGSIILSAFVSQHGAQNLNLNQWAMTAVLTCPIMFSGIIFSVLIGRAENIGSAMAMNMLGALSGGMLEYNAMFLGYRALYFIAIAIYLAGFASIYYSNKVRSAAVATASSEVS